MKIINMTPHIIRLNDGTEYLPSGEVARVTTSHELVYNIRRKPDMFKVTFGMIKGLPSIPEEDTWYIVSSLVAIASKNEEFYTWYNLISPATSHPDCVRKDGQVWSVPGFVWA